MNCEIKYTLSDLDLNKKELNDICSYLNKERYFKKYKTLFLKTGFIIDKCEINNYEIFRYGKFCIYIYLDSVYVKFIYDIDFLKICLKEIRDMTNYFLSQQKNTEKINTGYFIND